MTRPDIKWDNIETVLLDMDGTLLDLNFDNHFWQEHVPLRYAQLHNLSIEESKSVLYAKFRSAEGTLDWYCVDYWSSQLQLDIEKLKKEVNHLIAIHPHVLEFLEAVKKSGRRLLLVTNAHVKSLEIKMQQTRLAGHFDHVVVSHDLGHAKESYEFWDKLKAIEPYNNDSTLLVDDSLPVLRAAQHYGIVHLLAVRKPDTRREEKNVEGFKAIYHFDDIMPVS
ncbi:MAG: GMP/IMP nucleotidase [Gammaproteobacteria bacterium]|nr:GMP/IMP nucleotidase [Gammaproteobacteria bacterium]